MVLSFVLPPRPQNLQAVLNQLILRLEAASETSRTLPNPQQIRPGSPC
jgi:hypothetical protein